MMHRTQGAAWRGGVSMISTLEHDMFRCAPEHGSQAISRAVRNVEMFQIARELADRGPGHVLTLSS